MTKHLLHISECYMSFQLRLDKLIELAALALTLLGIFS